MSQKKLKKLRKLENVNSVKEIDSEPVLGIRQIIKENWKFLVILCVSIFVLYFNALHGDYVSDDYATITQDPGIFDLGKNLQTKSIPIIYKSIIAIVFGIKDPFIFHLFSVIMYILVCLVAFIVLRLIFDRMVSVLTLILFVTLPIHVEAVSWISGEPYLLSSFLILISFVFFILFLRSKKKKYFILMLISLLLLYYADRFRGFSVILFWFLYLISFKEKSKIKIDLWKIFLLVLGVLAFILIFSWPWINNRIQSVNSGYNGSGSIFYNPFFQYPTSVAKYLQLMLLPADLTLYHTMYILPVWLNWMIFLLYLTGVVYFFFKDKKIFFALAFIFLAAVGSMTPVKVSWLVAERYLFLGSLGFCLFLVLFFQKFQKKWKLPLFVLFIMVVGYYCVRVYFRNNDWRTNHSLWVNTCLVSPNSHNAWNNIGDDYDKLGQYENAIKGFTQSTIVKPDYADAFHNRANIFYKIGRYDLARDSYETALYFGPQLYQSYFSLLQIDLLEKRYDLAMVHLEKLNKVRPNDMQVYYIAALVYANMGRIDQAVPILQEIVKTVPSFTEAKTLLKQITTK